MATFLVVLAIVVGVIAYGMTTGVVWRAASVYFQRTCKKCAKRAPDMCNGHDGAPACIAFTWPLSLLICWAVRWGMTKGEQVAEWVLEPDRTPRQQRKLLEAQNQKSLVQIEQTKAHTAYLESLAVLSKEGVHIDPSKIFGD